MTAQTCGQPGCPGQIEDGYCNICGSPAGAAPVPATATGATGSASPGPSTSHHSTTAISSRLSSSPLGSARLGSTRPTRRLLSTRSRTQHLGAGITSVPSAPVPDPSSVVMAKPEVQEAKRFCSSCGAPVGRSRDGVEGRTEGFCPKCRRPYSFSPKLLPGQLAGGQYEVVGCLAHGGLGWVYLAKDRNVSDRYVVLKGLLNTGDADAYAAAVSERKFLAEVQHPLIVEIYNFTQQDGAGYIVMEYVGGKSLKDLLKARQAANGGKYDPFPVDQAIAYIVEILPSISYLHSQGLLYCDFKPDNVIQAGDSLKLIDLGGVRRVDDQQSAIYGTIGFQAPEVADVGPSVASDIYTIGRTLAVLAFEFRGYQSTFVSSLPEVEDTPVFQRYDSFYRLLAKATAASPDDRFQSVDELRDQLLGVLRETVALDTAKGAATHSTASALFGPPAASGSTLEWSELPPLLVDQSDPAAAWLAGVSIADPRQRLTVLEREPDQTIELKLARVRAAIESSNFPLADRIIADILTADPWEWRASWLSGVSLLARRNAKAATADFNTVLGQVPGELAPKLALALACELAGERDVAARLYQVCTIVDANYTAPAAFGLARMDYATGDLQAALEALDLIGPMSGAYIVAREARAGMLAASNQGLQALADAMASLDHITIERHDRLQLLAQVLATALSQVRSTGPNGSIKIDGISAIEKELQLGLEKTYRELATLEPDRDARIAMVDAANLIRPRTLV